MTRTLATGAASFIGMQVCRALLVRGDAVPSTDSGRPPSERGPLLAETGAGNERLDPLASGASARA